MQETYRIETPENVTFAYEVAGIGSRFLAALVDHFIIGMVWLVVLLGVLTGLDLGSQTGRIVAVAVGSLLLLWLCGYYILFELVWSGQTPGKRLVGLRVLHGDGTPETFVDALVRNVVRLADFLPAYYALGLVVMFLNRESRRLGDFAAGTVVVKERREVTLQGLAAPSLATIALPAVPAPPGLPIERLSADDYELVADYFRRRYQFNNSPELARRIAIGLARKLQLSETDFTPAGAETFLEQIAAAYRARGSDGVTE